MNKDPIQTNPKNTAVYAAIFVFLLGLGEALGGWWSGSLTLLSDAGHMVTDALALALAAFAGWIKRRPATDKHTYGFGRLEVLSAWLSSLLLLLVVISLAIEAINRLQNPPNITSTTVMVIALLGLIVNCLTAWILHRGEKTINTQAALLHVISDLLGSIVALLSGAIIYFTGWSTIDPILSLLICLLILSSTIRLLRESSLVLMETTPSHLDYQKVATRIKNIPGINNIHDLHIWTLTSDMILLTVHVVVSDEHRYPHLTFKIRKILQEEFKISHITIQIETLKQASLCDLGLPHK